MHGASSPRSGGSGIGGGGSVVNSANAGRLDIDTLKKRFRLAAKDSSSHLVLTATVIWFICVILLHTTIGRAGIWIAITLSCGIIDLIDIFILVTLQEYSDGVIREPLDVQRTCTPLSSLGIIFRALICVQMLHAGSVLLCLIYGTSLLYELGLFRRYPQTIDVTTLWKDAPGMQSESRWKVFFGVVMFLIIMVTMMAALLGARMFLIN